MSNIEFIIIGFILLSTALFLIRFFPSIIKGVIYVTGGLTFISLLIMIFFYIILEIGGHNTFWNIWIDLYIITKRDFYYNYGRFYNFIIRIF